jgi:hypothetical protein
MSHMTDRQDADVPAVETEIEKARREGGEQAWENAVCAIEVLVANWDQDTRGRAASDALNSAGEQLVEALKEAGPTEFLEMRWKGAQHAMAAESKAATAGIALKASETERKRLRLFAEGELKMAEAQVLASFLPMHIEAALERRRRILIALHGDEHPGGRTVVAEKG